MLERSWLLGIAVVVITGVVFLIFHHPRVGALFTQHIPSRPRRRIFLAAISFFLTFAVARSLAYANYHHLGPFHDIYIRGRHIHHLVWGILILLAVGYGWLAEVGTGTSSSSAVSSGLMALLYGAGAALTLDEFALWLNLGDVYWTRQGRASIDAVVLFGALLLIGIGGRPFLRAVAREFLHLRLP
ncbi:MAG TPA: hypothetical protein VGS20_17595 [Candidatus Acidoferrales bacterium]|nr:hypothetical protein [Candidatus Acidoferrales bacterium]